MKANENINRFQRADGIGGTSFGRADRSRNTHPSTSSEDQSSKIIATYTEIHPEKEPYQKTVSATIFSSLLQLSDNERPHPYDIADNVNQLGH